MNRLGLLLILFLLSCSSKNNKKIEDNIFDAQIEFSDSIHDFGKFSSLQPIQKCSFKFKNSGNVPAVIISAIPSCQCTSVDYIKEPIMPGKVGAIEVAFNGKESTKGYFKKSVNVRINSFHVYTLKIQGCMD